MDFRKIDVENWYRKEHFEHFYNKLNCAYSITNNICITELMEVIQKRQFKFYPVMLYLIAKTVNDQDEFKTTIDENDSIGIWESINPSYTIFHPDDKSYSSIWTIYSDNFELFYNNCLSDINRYGDIKGFSTKPNEPLNTFSVSNLPWLNFSSFHLELETKYLAPIVTFGKYTSKGNDISLPLNIRMHHSVCDGYHIHKFFEGLRQHMQSFY